jgi:hypothetical protein
MELALCVTVGRLRCHTNTAAAVAATAAAAIHQRLIVDDGRAAGATPVGVTMPSSSRNTSAADCGRSAGRFSRQRMTSDASAGGTLGRMCAIGSASLLMTAASSACGE